MTLTSIDTGNYSSRAQVKNLLISCPQIKLSATYIMLLPNCQIRQTINDSKFHITEIHVVFKLQNFKIKSLLQRLVVQQILTRGSVVTGKGLVLDQSCGLWIVWDGPGQTGKKTGCVANGFLKDYLKSNIFGE